MEETLDLEEHGKSLAAPIIFIIVFTFQFLSTYLENMKKKISMNATDVQLRAEIEQLLKEASLLSQPSTFAQAAKLRRMAAVKEKERAKNRELHSKEIKLSYDSYVKVLMMAKILVYSALILWFWRFPVATISEQLVQPLGRILSWRAGGPFNDNVMGVHNYGLSRYMVATSSKEMVDYVSDPHADSSLNTYRINILKP